MKSILFNDAMKTFSPIIAVWIAYGVSSRIGDIIAGAVIAYLLHRGYTLFKDIRVAKERLKELEDALYNRPTG